MSRGTLWHLVQSVDSFTEYFKKDEWGWAVTAVVYERDLMIWVNVITTVLLM